MGFHKVQIRISIDILSCSPYFQISGITLNLRQLGGPTRNFRWHGSDTHIFKLPTIIRAQKGWTLRKQSNIRVYLINSKEPLLLEKVEITIDKIIFNVNILLRIQIFPIHFIIDLATNDISLSNGHKLWWFFITVCCIQSSQWIRILSKTLGLISFDCASLQFLNLHLFLRNHWITDIRDLYWVWFNQLYPMISCLCHSKKLLIQVLG